MRTEDWRWPKPYRNSDEAVKLALEQVSKTEGDIKLVLHGLRLLARQRAQEYADGQRDSTLASIQEVEALEARYEMASTAMSDARWCRLDPVSKSHWQPYGDLDADDKKRAREIADAARSAPTDCMKGPE